MASRRLRKVAVVRNTPVPIHDRRASDANRAALVGTVTVDDPLAVEPGDKIVVFRNLRNDPLAAMHDAKQVDEAQFYAGRHWQKAYELSELGGVMAIDPSKEAVDGGRFPDPLSDATSRGLADLARVVKPLGLDGGALISDILGRGMTISAVAVKRGLKSQWDIRGLGEKFRNSLDVLAVVYGYAMPRRKE